MTGSSLSCIFIREVCVFRLDGKTLEKYVISYLFFSALVLIIEVVDHALPCQYKSSLVVRFFLSMTSWVGGDDGHLTIACFVTCK